MSESLEYLRFTALKSRPSTNDVFLCSLVVGVPVQGRQSFAAAKAIEEALPQHQRSVRDYFSRRGVLIPQDAAITFQTYHQNALPADYEGKPADFVSADGKKFWVERCSQA
jgi:hypothetical protein